MKILSIDIKEEAEQIGLKPIKIDKLKDIVIVTGKNGSGKSRLLDLIEHELNWRFINIQNNSYQRNNYSVFLTKIKDYIKGFKDTIYLLPLCEPIISENLSLDQAKYLIEQFEYLKFNRIEKGSDSVVKSDLKDFYTLLERCIKIHTQPFFEHNVVKYIPKDLQLTDHNSQSKNQIIKLAKSVANVNMSSLFESTYSYIQVIQDRRFNASHPDMNFREETIKKEEDYRNLNILIKQILNVELDRDIDGNCLLYGKPIEVAGLSNGQKILLQIIVAIHAQGIGIENYILILDEPENHLHPSAIIDVIERFRKYNSNGQIWIATH